MQLRQSFVDRDAKDWIRLERLPGVELLALAEPVPGGSIHRARLAIGTVIPVHTHPADEYVYVIEGVVETGGRRCEAGTFWVTPRGVRQGPHVAITYAELLTVRLGAMGTFGERGEEDDAERVRQDLRGSVLSYEAPGAPADDPKEWDANR